MQENELTKELTRRAQASFDRAIFLQDTYGRLINWRKAKIDDEVHKDKVLRGYGKMMRFVLRGLHTKV